MKAIPPSARRLLYVLRQADMLRLRAEHLTEQARSRAADAVMLGSVTARARADIHVRFAHRFALLLAERDQPGFTAKMAALEAEQSAALIDRIRELSDLARRQRRASRQLLRDRQRRERRALAMRWKVDLGSLAAAHRFAPPATNASVRTAGTRAAFRVVGRVTLERITRLPARLPLSRRRRRYRVLRLGS